MRAKRKQRLIVLIAIMFSLSVAVALALYGLSQNINLFFSPTEIFQGKAPKQHAFRIGGMVKQGSVHYAKKDLNVSFMLTDFQHDVLVHYQGVLPDLFREGQGIVADGYLDAQGRFQATMVLAKHGANYMPTAVRDMLTKRKP